MQKTVEDVDRNSLYAEIWADPVTIVAQRYGLSDGRASLMVTLDSTVPPAPTFQRTQYRLICSNIDL